MHKYYIVTLLLWISTLPNFLWANTSPKISVSTDKNSYYDFEYIYYTYTIENADINGVAMPEFEGVKLIGSPQVRNESRSYVTIIKGQRVDKGEKKIVITFVLQSLKRGSIVLPDAEMQVNGQNYSAKGTQIFVKKPSIDANQLNQEHFVNVECSNYYPFKGESFTLKYTVFSIHPLSDPSQFITKNAFINFGDFAVKEIERSAPTRVSIKGQNFYMMEFQAHVLTPVSVGTQNIPSFPIEYASYKVTSNGWFGTRERLDKKVHSPKLTIQVKALPDEPKGFTGLVGNFKLELKVDKHELKINDAVTLKFVLSGTGNFEAIKKIPLNLPASWEVFEPSISENTQVGTTGKKGSKTFEYVCIPRKGGITDVPETELLFFNPYTGKYAQSKTQSVKISVIDDGSVLSSSPQRNTIGNKVELLDESIRYIKTNINLNESTHEFVLKTSRFKLLFGAGVCSFLLLSLFPLLVGVFPDREIKRQVKVKDLLKQIQGINENDQNKYILLQDLLEKYLELAFKMDKANLNQDNIKVKMDEYSLLENNITDYLQLHEKINSAAFAGGNIDFKAIKSSALDWIQDTEKQLNA